MLNEKYILKKIEPYLNDKRQISEAEFFHIFGELTKREQYEVINLMINNNIDYVEEKEVWPENKIIKKPKDNTHNNVQASNYVITRNKVDYSNLKSLTNEQLCYLYQQGETEVFSTLVNKNKKFILDRALKMYKIFGRSDFYIEDFYQEGVFGLMKAAEKFDISLGFSFLTYSTNWIDQTMHRSVVNNGFLIRLPVHVYEKVIKVSHYIRKNPSANKCELLRILNDDKAFGKDIDMKTLNMYLEYQENYLNIASLNALVGEDKETELLEFLPDEVTPTPEEQVVGNLQSETLKSIISKLTERERDVIYLRFGFEGNDTKTLEEIGEIYGVTRERIRQIEAKAIRKLRSHSKKLKDLYYEK